LFIAFNLRRLEIQSDYFCGSDSRLAVQEIPRRLWNPKSFCCGRRSLSLDPVLSRMNPAHNFTSHFFKLHFNITIQSTTSSPKCFFLRNFLTKILYEFFTSSMRTAYLVNLVSSSLVKSIIYETSQLFPAPIT
jgi:hypothetical protein